MPRESPVMIHQNESTDIAMRFKINSDLCREYSRRRGWPLYSIKPSVILANSCRELAIKLMSTSAHIAIERQKPPETVSIESILKKPKD